MASTLNALTSGGGGIVTAGDASGVIQLQTSGTPTVTVDTSGNVTTAGYLNSPNTFGFKNRLIDAGFIINQRVYVSGTSLSAGTYAHDRWKGGASGGTYTFTQGSLGVPIVITITTGSIQQIIEGCNVPEGGTYVLSWTGTATASINGGTAGSSPLVVTGVTAGANMTIQFNTGTVSYPQLEKGSTATSFDYRPYTTEQQLCYRYCYRWTAGVAFSYVSLIRQYSTTNGTALVKLPVSMRGTISGSTIPIVAANWDYSITAINPVSNQSTDNNFVQCDVTGSFTGANYCGALGSNGTAQPNWIQWTSEL